MKAKVVLSDSEALLEYRFRESRPRTPVPVHGTRLRKNLLA
jgi:hypothetical protein